MIHWQFTNYVTTEVRAMQNSGMQQNIHLWNRSYWLHIHKPVPSYSLLHKNNKLYYHNRTVLLEAMITTCTNYCHSYVLADQCNCVSLPNWNWLLVQFFIVTLRELLPHIVPSRKLGCLMWWASAPSGCSPNACHIISTFDRTVLIINCVYYCWCTWTLYLFPIY